MFLSLSPGYTIKDIQSIQTLGLTNFTRDFNTWDLRTWIMSTDLSFYNIQRLVDQSYSGPWLVMEVSVSTRNKHRVSSDSPTHA